MRPAVEARRIADELRRSVSGPAWHGPALAELLADVRESEANLRPVAQGHTIHELVLHMTAWQEVAAGVLRGEPAPEAPFDEDWPTSEGRSWGTTVEHLLTSLQGLVHAVAAVGEEQLEATVMGRDYPVYVLLHGVAQHNAYHGGQIALLKKLLQARTS